MSGRVLILDNNKCCHPGQIRVNVLISKRKCQRMPHTFRKGDNSIVGYGLQWNLPAQDGRRVIRLRTTWRRTMEKSQLFRDLWGELERLAGNG